jgi:acylphosphatase
MQTSVHIRVKGVVQGVGFRYFVSRLARQLGLVGYVRNVPNGDVEIFAEGERSLLEEFVRGVRIGPRASHVSALDIVWKEDRLSYSDFSIL